MPAPLPKADTAPRSAQPEQSEPQPEQPEPQPEQQPLRATNMAWGGNWEALGTAVRISNLSKRMNAEQVKELFEEGKRGVGTEVDDLGMAVCSCDILTSTRASKLLLGLSDGPVSQTEPGRPRVFQLN